MECTTITLMHHSFRKVRKIMFNKNNIPLSALLSESTKLKLMDAGTIAYEYEEGKKTDKIKGIKVTLLETKDFDKFQVTISGITSLPFSDNEISKRPNITLNNPRVKLYARDNVIFESISADGIALDKSTVIDAKALQ